MNKTPNKKSDEMSMSVLDASSIKEIVSILSDIDDKILSLNECSATDFATFNTQLKKNHKQIKIISDNTHKMFEIIGGEDNTNCISDISVFRERLEVYIGSFEKQIDYNILKLEDISKGIKSMFLPFKNFIQNLSTFKYLVTYLKLNLTCVEGSELISIENEVEAIVKLIHKANAVYPILDINMNHLKHSVNNTLIKLKDIKNKNTLNVSAIFNQIDFSIDLLTVKNKEAISQTESLKEKTDMCSGNINEIITSLQFQDIIRQKMEHIQDTHKEIISELNSLSASSDKITGIRQAKYVFRIRDIAELQVAQSIHTNNNYQAAIEKITRKFSEIGETISNVSSISSLFPSHTYKTDETYFKEIDDKCANTLNIIQQFIKIDEDLNKKIKFIYNSIDNLSNDFNIINSINDNLENLAAKIINKFNNPNICKKDLEKTTKHIQTLANDYSNMEEITRLYKQISESSSGLNLGENNKDLETKVGDKLSSLSVNAHAITEKLNAYNDEINKILIQNNDLSLKMTGEIKSSIYDVKYYDFFEKVIEDIIQNLNTIYNKLVSQIPNKSEYEKKYNLKSVEELYTMESERLIHESIANNEGGISVEIPDEIDDEGDLELF